MMETPKRLTKKQRKEFLRLWIGSVLLNHDFGFDETNIHEDDILILENDKGQIACKFLKGDQSFTTTTSIFDKVSKKQVDNGK
ncbi:hypothetical protein OZ664_11805 [Elizabethkingia sp. HX WHF]|uniref:hypothetical protein n=1 Tax=Elizabethkingia sp. HX WHF TaxID=3003190 RepID=UPI002A24DE5F|nr:hypothetical protein [Elizabethkingia sp. HX WHF]MDX8564685.1 hypothetical protein [Elizabethkingia sp. HX WHF]